MIRFSLQDALLTRDASPIENESSTLDRAWGIPGPLTAFEAYDVAERKVREIDLDYALHSMGSVSAVTVEGRSDCWQIEFRLPVRRGIARYFIRTLRDEQDGSLLGSIEIEQQLFPLPEDDLERAADEPRAFDPALPVPFRDSPEVVRYLPLQGNEPPFVRMATALNEDGRAIWKVQLGDESRDLPMAA